MVTGSTYNALPDLFNKSFATHLAESLQGLVEYRKEIEVAKAKTNQVALFIFAAGGTFVAATLFIGRSFKVISFALGVCGIAVALIYYLYQRYVVAQRHVQPEIEHWMNIFTLISQGDTQKALPLLTDQLTSHARANPDAEHKIEIEEVFKTSAYEGFALLDFRDAAVSGERNRYLLKTIFATSLLFALLQELSKLPDSEKRTFLQTNQAEQILCKKMFMNQRCGLTDAEKQCFALFADNDQDLISHLPDIKLPKRFSVGHGLLLSIHTWMSNIPDTAVASCKDPKDAFKSWGGAHLENWKANLIKAREWLKKENQLGALEERFIDSLGKANDMREFWQACYDLPKDDVDLLSQRAISF